MLVLRDDAMNDTTLEKKTKHLRVGLLLFLSKHLKTKYGNIFSYN